MRDENNHITKIKKRNGTIRDSRFNSLLLHNPFKIDGRNTWDLLAYIASYLEQINFFNVENHLEGDWKKLVEKDSLIYMASIINEPTQDLTRLIKEYDVDQVRKEDEKKEEIIDILSNCWDQIQEWAQKLYAINERNLADKILSSPIERIKFKRDFIVEDDLGNLDIQELKSKAKSNTNSAIILDELLHDFQKAIAHIKETTRRYFKQEFFRQDEHMPQNAMYIAFVLLYMRVVDKLNNVSQRHLDFYYKDVLQQESKKGTKTRAIVSFDLQPIVSQTIVPKGTLLSAGKILDSKTEILFETTETLVAHQTELVNIQTLYINSNPYTEIGTTEKTITSISYNRLFAFSKELVSRNHWYVFGANKKTIQDSQIKENETAKLGFIVGSPVLFLKEGRREINLRLNLEKSTAENTIWKLLEEISCSKEIGFSTAVSMVFDKAFRISYTSKDGWISFPHYLIDCSQESNYLNIKLQLDLTDPSVEMAEEIYESLDWPSIKVELDEFAPIFAYSFLKGLHLTSIDIDVDVEGAKDLTFYNNIGKMPTAKPFEMFGPQPKCGDYLMIGLTEIFKKEISDLNVAFEWDTVPNDLGGFDSYYKSYSEIVTNDSFRVQFSALSKGYWYPAKAKDSPKLVLFNTRSFLTAEGYETLQVNNTTNLDFSNYNELGLSNDHSLADPLQYNINTEGGFIKITLSDPEFGFGDSVYQKDYTEIATYNAQNKRQLPYPKPPFVPKVKSVTVNYKAYDKLLFTERIDAGDNSNLYNGQFKHITPYIVEDVLVDQMVKKKTILHNFEHEGHLILGLKGVRSRTDLSIYFNFLRSSTTIDIRDNSLNWEYFHFPKWRSFQQSAIIRDDTEGFLKSGIVILNMPHVPPEEKGIDDEILWIRASTSGDVENYPRLKGIYLNAVEAVCTSEDPSVVGKSIEKETISKLEGKLPDIKQVYQAAETFGGSIPESRERYYTRVSERLRHKGRAVTLWDYERLVLENFDDVKIVKCTSFNEKFKPIPGHVKVVVLSTRWSKRDPYYFSKTKLQRMKDYLNKISSSFIDIDVMNPAVEYLLVNCTVEFNKLDRGLNYRERLSEDISKFLSPINNMDQNTGGIGGSVVPSTVSNYVQNLPYVDKIIEFNIEHIIRHGMNDFTLDVHVNEEIISARSPWSILAPASDHRIYTKDDISDQDIPEDLKVGISTIGVGVDLIIGAEGE